MGRSASGPALFAASSSPRASSAAVPRAEGCSESIWPIHRASSGDNCTKSSRGHQRREAREPVVLGGLLFVGGERVPAGDEAVGGDAQCVHVIFRGGRVASGGAAAELPVVKLGLRAPVVGGARRVGLSGEDGSAAPGA